MKRVKSVRLRRMARGWPTFFAGSLFQFWKDSLGGLGAIAAFFAFAINWKIGNSRTHSLQLDSLSVAISSLVYAGLVWILAAAVIAAYKAIKQETTNATWHINERIYAEPVLVAVCVWTEHDTEKAAQIIFEDAEPNSLVNHSIVLDPPVEGRASAYLEPSPGMLDFLGQIRSAATRQPIKHVCSHAKVRLNGRTAYLRVKLDPGTVPVTARVYMRSFDIEEGSIHEMDSVKG